MNNSAKPILDVHKDLLYSLVVSSSLDWCNILNTVQNDHFNNSIQYSGSWSNIVTQYEMFSRCTKLSSTTTFSAIFFKQFLKKMLVRTHTHTHFSVIICFLNYYFFKFDSNKPINNWLVHKCLIGQSKKKKIQVNKVVVNIDASRAVRSFHF